ncbi:MAG: flippase [Oscillospiraceae bacterium]|nr:flippase [Oscillospiraceae bacterium]
MIRQHTIRENLLYNFLLQAATLVLPLILTPYLTRTIGPVGIGTYSYTNSIVQYFVLAGTLGTALYGTRQIAYARCDADRLARTFWQVFALRAIMLIITTTVYVAIYYYSKSPYRVCFLFQAVVLLANLADVSWLFAGLEDFKKTVFRSLAIKIIAFILVFALVKTTVDTWKYVFIQSGSLLIANVALWMCIPKAFFNVKKPFQNKEIDLRAIISLFIPQIAIDVYVLLDKSMLGALTNIEVVGFYDKAEQFAKLPLSILAIFSTVMLPVMSSLFEAQDHEKIIEYLNHYLRIILLTSIPAAFGIAGIAPQFIPWMLGKNFTPSIHLMVLLACLIPLISISNVIGRQYLIPSNHSKVLTISVTCGAFANLMLNIILIPKYQAIGACIATIIAELTVSVIQLLYSRSLISAKSLLICAGKCIIAGGVMFLTIWKMGDFLGAAVYTTALQIFVGTLLYFAILFAIKERTASELMQALYKGKRKTN